MQSHVRKTMEWSDMNYPEELQVVNRFWQSAPVNVYGLTEALGVPLRDEGLGTQFSGSIKRLASRKFVITVNANHFVTRKRFTVAHGLGHYMLHRHCLATG